MGIAIYANFGLEFARSGSGKEFARTASELWNLITMDAPIGTSFYSLPPRKWAGLRLVNSSPAAMITVPA
jgi:hypothetical protein